MRIQVRRTRSLLVALLAIVPAAWGAVVRSPDGRIAVTVDVDQDGIPQYSASYGGKEVMPAGKLGLRFESRPAMDAGFRVADTVTTSHDETWEQPWGESRFVRNHYNELRVRLREVKLKRSGSTWGCACSTTASASATSCPGNPATTAREHRRRTDRVPPRRRARHHRVVDSRPAMEPLRVPVQPHAAGCDPDGAHADDDPHCRRACTSPSTRRRWWTTPASWLRPARASASAHQLTPGSAAPVRYAHARSTRRGARCRWRRARRRCSNRT